MQPQETLDRRTALQALASGSLAPLAGCLSGDGTTTTGSDTATSPTPTATGVFEDVFFEAQDMVVDLQDDAGVSQVNLIGPEGSKVAGASVPTGATRVRLQILDIDPGLGGYEHYSPGEYELVAQLRDGTFSLTTRLRPALKISDVRTWENGPEGDESGKVAVEVTNTGSAPTWVYDITYDNAPNSDVNDELVDGAGVPQISNYENVEQLIVEPQSDAVFVGIDSPLIFSNQDDADCSGEIEFTVIVGTAVGQRLQRDIRAEISGQPISVGLTGQYVCDEIALEPISPQTTSKQLRGGR